MTIQRLVLILVCLAPVAVLAEGPGKDARSPAGPGLGQRARGGPDRGSGRDGERPRAQRPGDGEDSPDWSDVAKFFEETSPNRWHAFRNMSPVEQETIRKTMRERYDAFQAIRRESGEKLWNIKKQQINIEDELYRIKSRLKGKVPPPEVEKLRAELRAKVKEMMQLRLQEREVRLARLREILQMETKSLEEDRANLDKVVQKRVEAELSDNSDNVPDRMRPRGGHGGVGGGGGEGSRFRGPPTRSAD